jgi:small-conductance mechanosensitive channel
MARAGAWFIVLALWASIAMAATPGLDAPAKPAKGAAETAKVPADLQPGQVDALVAGLSDAQVRRLLVDTLRREADARGTKAEAEEDGGGAQLLNALRARIRHVNDSLKATREAVADWQDHWAAVLRNLTDDQGWPAVGHCLLVLVLMFAVGWAAELSLAWVLPQAHPHAPVAGEEHPWLHRATGAGLVLLIRLVRVTVFAMVALVVSFLFYETFDPMRELLLAALAWLIGMRFWFAISRLVLAPREPAARLIPLADTTSLRVHRQGLVLFGWFSASFFGAGLLKILGLEARLLDLFQIVSGGLFTLMLALCFVSARRDVHAALTAPGTSRLAQALAHSWLALVIGYLALAWAFWAVNVLEGDRVGAAAAVRSLMIVLAVPLIDRLAALAFGRLLRDRLGLDGQPLPRFAKARRIAQSVLRSLLLFAAVVLLVQSWGGGVLSGVGTPFGTTMLRAAFSVTVALLLTWIAWEFIAHFIDKRLAEAPSGDENAASREKTLLPLLRRFIIGVLVVMVTMIVLSSIGIDIGPLLAGAGIVGIAIGFGAQTLVRDIMSGLFFLIDDAFRVGEYVDLGRLRGTVERITVRALVLRHHRGALHTVPFGQIQAITNYNRDWLIDKVEMRLPYDVDVDRVKKLIKQIGAALQEDAEIGPKLIETLKSQGISRFEAGGMVLRAKFMCKPREQFIVRREALKRIKAVFAANGIQFADTSVVVRGDGAVPPLAAAAAAQAANDAARPAGPGSTGTVGSN